MTAQAQIGERFTSPVGRLVQGSAFELQDKDQQGNLRVYRDGPKAGQPNPVAYLGVAFQKADPAWPAFDALLRRQAVAGFPNLFPQGPAGPCVLPSFSFKVIDGDGVDTAGKRWSEREGFAGHWIVRFQSAYLPKVFNAGQYDPSQQIFDPRALKRGYFVRVNGSVKPNGNATKPGLYVNVDMVEIAAMGPEIVTGPNAAEAFGGGPGALPPGAVPPGSPPPPPGALPPPSPAAAPALVMLPAAGGQTYEAMRAAGWTDETLLAHGMAAAAPAAPPAPPPAPAYVPPAPAAPGAPPPPPGAPAAYAGYYAPPGAPPPPAAAPAFVPPAPAAPARVMLPAAGGQTYEAMIALGWTDETLRQHGMMA